MRVPLDWLKEYVDIKMPIDEFAHKLTIAGLEVTSIEDTSFGKVIEIEITTNRPDWLSLLGIAREVYALNGKGKLEIPVSNLPHKKNFEQLFKVSVLTEEKCPRYTVRIIEGVKIKPSPDWLKKKIESMGLRPVCNVVDITNFVLFEYGQPLHAFDLDKIEAKEIRVRLAKNGEKITTIDGVERVLYADTLVIADSVKPIAIAGIMGGENTEIDSNTKNIILESAFFYGPFIRGTSRKLGLSSDSSYRFERNVDWEGVLKASDRAAQLICEIAGGNIKEEFFDSTPNKKTAREIKLNKEEIKNVLGVEIKPKKVIEILENLGLSSKGFSKDTFEFEIPSFRQDLQLPIDLIEEIARIWGYENIPLRLPVLKPNLEIEESHLRKAEDTARQIFAAMGFNEIMSYTLVSRDVLRKLRFKLENVLNIQNPLSSEVEMLRPMLVSGIIQSLSFNLNRSAEQAKVFELAHIYWREAEEIKEELSLGFGLSGEKYIYDWANKPKDLTFFDVKAAAEVLFKALGISGVSFSSTGALNFFDPSQSAVILHKGAVLGFIGALCEELLDGFDLNKPIYIGEIFLESIIPLINFDKKFRSFSPYPFITRDIAILIDENIPSVHAVSVIKKIGNEIIEDIRLFDCYAGKQVPKGRVSLAFSIKYQSKNRTLTDEEVNEVHAKICSALHAELKAEIR
ncbi:MAG: phenylalanine--tRNA ligase subunit beta [Candidatus Omnitrophota bacterium]